MKRALLIALVVVAGCRDRFVFVCSDDSQCLRNGAQGACLPAADGARYCTFDDGMCRRWDPTAASPWAGHCEDDMGTSGPGDMSMESPDMSALDMSALDMSPTIGPDFTYVQLDLSYRPAYDFTLAGDGGIALTGCSPGTNDLLSVWGASGDDIWAVGKGGIILHYHQTQNCVAESSGTTATLRAVWGRAPYDVYAAGDGVILHRDISGMWTKVQTLPVQHEVWTLGGTSSTAYAGVMIVDVDMGSPTGGTAYSSTTPMAWNAIAFPGTSPNPLTSIWSNGSDVFIGGGSGECRELLANPAWKDVGPNAFGMSSGHFMGLTADTGNLIAATQNGQLWLRTTSWSKQVDYTSGACSNAFNDVRAVPGRTLAVGNEGCVAASYDGGQTWHAFDRNNGGPYTHHFYGLWMDANSSLVVAVGSDGANGTIDIITTTP